MSRPLPVGPRNLYKMLVSDLIGGKCFRAKLIFRAVLSVGLYKMSLPICLLLQQQPATQHVNTDNTFITPSTDLASSLGCNGAFRHCRLK